MPPAVPPGPAASTLIFLPRFALRIGFSARAIAGGESLDLMVDDQTVLHLKIRPEQAILVANDQRGGQWGSRLLRALERLARASGCARLVLDTGLANARAQRFYFREGLYTGALRFQKQFDTP